MKAKRFTEEQIIGVLKQAETGGKTKDLCDRPPENRPAGQWCADMRITRRNIWLRLRIDWVRCAW
jgi:hypothetical protein